MGAESFYTARSLESPKHELYQKDPSSKLYKNAQIEEEEIEKSISMDATSEKI